MKKFKLPRKKKKQYIKDLIDYPCAYFKVLKSRFNFKVPRRDVKKITQSIYNCYKSKNDWELFYFERRIDVRCKEIILTYPDYDKITKKYEFDPSLAKPATNEQLLAYYKEYYPNDRLAHHYCRQNRHKYSNFI